jgi:hypothetical protein
MAGRSSAAGSGSASVMPSRGSCCSCLLIANSAIGRRALIDIAPTAWRETREADSEWVFDCATLGTGVEVGALRQGPSPPDRLCGLLQEEHHGGVPESLPATQATVRRIRLATREFHLVGSVFKPEGPVGLADVERVPARFNAEARGTMKDDVWIYSEGVLAEIEAAP